MMWIVKFIQKRPTDKTIKIWRIIFGLVLISALSYGLLYQNMTIDNSYFFWLVVLSETWIEILKYIMISIWLVPIIMWAFDICLLKKKYIKIVQIIFWFMLFYIAWSINNDSPKIWIDFLIWIMWVLPVIAWITWKCITKKCLKYREKITKIRV